MRDIREELRRELDEKVNSALVIAEQYACGVDFRDHEYFAADVISEAYSGKYAKGLTCACQCFLYSRLAHMDEKKISAGSVLAGDYFAGLVSGFDLPEDKPEILERFADFTIDEIKKVSKGSALSFDAEKYRKLFLEVAEVMDE